MLGGWPSEGAALAADSPACPPTLTCPPSCRSGEWPWASRSWGAPPCRCPSWGAGDPRTLDFLVVLLQLTLGGRDTGSWAVGHLEKEACVEIDSVSMEDCRGDPSGPPPSLLASLGSNSPNSPGATSQHTHGTRFPFCHSRRWRSSPGHGVTPTTAHSSLVRCTHWCGRPCLSRCGRYRPSTVVVVNAPPQKCREASSGTGGETAPPTTKASVGLASFPGTRDTWGRHCQKTLSVFLQNGNGIV